MQSEQDEDTFIGGGVMKKSSFVEYITTITSRDKSQILNLLQYGGLTIIPILIILKCMKQFEINNMNTSNGKLIYSVTNTKAPLNRKNLVKVIQLFINNFLC